ncbi:hypothetical protein BCR44DRAFT_1438073, partial [Catenaria anguillulae PL171]
EGLLGARWCSLVKAGTAEKCHSVGNLIGRSGGNSGQGGKGEDGRGRDRLNDSCANDHVHLCQVREREDDRHVLRGKHIGAGFA